MVSPPLSLSLSLSILLLSLVLHHLLLSLSIFLLLSMIPPTSLSPPPQYVSPSLFPFIHFLLSMVPRSFPPRYVSSLSLSLSSTLCMILPPTLSLSSPPQYDSSHLSLLLLSMIPPTSLSSPPQYDSPPPLSSPFQYVSPSLFPFIHFLLSIVPHSSPPQYVSFLSLSLSLPLLPFGRVVLFSSSSYLGRSSLHPLSLSQSTPHYSLPTLLCRFSLFLPLFSLSVSPCFSLAFISPHPFHSLSLSLSPSSPYQLLTQFSTFLHHHPNCLYFSVASMDDVFLLLSFPFLLAGQFAKIADYI
ncbi:unnamed protein product [Acanthosepion pharaonis]|uniref:Uncharacterized protein n=1 Tax=Acanthosepion pharaonis TaxID=158019 RepID=A0A812EUC6_ACAPH|nr:unnamed protein product [Sepia pharaonis]